VSGRCRTAVEPSARSTSSRSWRPIARVRCQRRSASCARYRHRRRTRSPAAMPASAAGVRAVVRQATPSGRYARHVGSRTARTASRFAIGPAAMAMRPTPWRLSARQVGRVDVGLALVRHLDVAAQRHRRNAHSVWSRRSAATTVPGQADRSAAPDAAPASDDVMASSWATTARRAPRESAGTRRCRSCGQRQEGRVVGQSRTAQATRRASASAASAS
jgi:hypothetical protein